MASLAMLYLLILEPFLAVKLGDKNFLRNRSSSKDEQMAKFYLFTPKNRFGISQSQSLSLNGGSKFYDFDSSLDTKVIIHGFLDSISIGDWMHDMKDEFLKHGDFNIIVVDWSSGNSIPFSRAAANTQKVGNETAKLIALLRDRFGAKTETFHIIGHSLGSHVAGYVGEIIKPLGRITGLDPAMYHFTNAPPRKRLDTSDAIFVDIIHTDAGGIGMVKNIGHVDFYPNGGSDQPGCTAINYITSLQDKGVLESVRGLICSHMRSIFLFMESINGCTTYGSHCSSYSDYNDGNCGTSGPKEKKLTPMGYHADKLERNSQKFYLLTSGDSPYCVFEYRLNMMKSNDTFSASSLMSNLRLENSANIQSFEVTLFGNGVGALKFILDETNEFGRLSHVLTSQRKLGIVHGALVKWEPVSVDIETHLPLISSIELIPSNVPNSRSVKLCSGFNAFDSVNSVIVLRSIDC